MGRRPLLPGELGSTVISKQGSGGYSGRAYTRDGGGVRHRLRAYGSTEEEVVADLKRQASGRTSASRFLSPDSPISLAFDAWIKTKSKFVRPQTIRIYQDTVRWLAPLIGALPIKEFRPREVNRILEDIEDTRSPSAAHQARTALSGAFEAAMRDEAIDYNPVRHLAKGKRRAKLPTALDAQQVAVLRDLIWEREQRVARYTGSSVHLLRWVVEIMLGSGLRISEVLALRHADIDWEHGRIEVTGTLVDATDDWHLVRQEELKGRGQARYIDLPQFALRALAEARQNALTLTARLPDKPAVQGQSVGEWVSARNVRRSLRDLRQDPKLTAELERTGLTSEDLTPHMLRRTAATLVAQATGKLQEAQKLLGHSDERTTKAHYAGKAFRIVGSASLLDEILGGGPGVIAS